VIETDRPRPDPAAGSEAPADKVTISTGFRILTPFVRQFWRAFAAAAVLASLSSLAMLGPLWAVYRAVDEWSGESPSALPCSGTRVWRRCSCCSSTP